MYEKDGEKYFVVDGHLHFWDASPENWVKGRRSTPRAGSSASTPTRASGRRRRTGRSRSSRSTPWTTSSKDVFEDGHVDIGVFQSTYLKEWYTTGSTTIEQNAALLERFPGKLIVNGRWDPREGEAGPAAARGGRKRSTASRASSSTRPSGTTARAAGRSSDPEARAVPGEVPGARHQEHPRPQGPDDLAAGQGRVRRLRRRPRGDGLPGAELHRRARRAAADRGLLLHGDAGAQRLRRPRRRHRRPHARPPAVLRQGHGRAAVLGRRGQDAVRLRLRDLGAEVADRGLRRLGLPDDDVLRLPALDTEAARRRSSASTRPSSTASRCRRSCGCRPRPEARGARTTRSWSRARRDACARRSSRRSGTVYDPELDEPITDARLRRLLRRVRRRRRRRAPAAAHAAVRAELRVPDGRRRARARCARLPGVGDGQRRARRPLHGRRDQRRGRARRRASPTRSRARPRATSTRCARCSGARRSSPARRACARRCWPPARRAEAVDAARRRAPGRRTPSAAASCGGARPRRTDADAPAFVRRRRRRRRAPTSCRAGCAARGS